MKFLTAGGFYWRYTDETITPQIDLTSFIPIADFSNYMVNNNGDVYSIYKKDIMNISYDKYGLGHIKVQHKVKRSVDGVSKEVNESHDFLIHNLVASHFVPNDDPTNKTAVRHIDGDKSNNHHTNLYWLNQQDAQRVSLIARRPNNH